MREHDPFEVISADALDATFGGNLVVRGALAAGRMAATAGPAVARFAGRTLLHGGKVGWRTFVYPIGISASVYDAVDGYRGARAAGAGHLQAAGEGALNFAAQGLYNYYLDR